MALQEASLTTSLRLNIQNSQFSNRLAIFQFKAQHLFDLSTNRRMPQESPQQQ